MTVRTFFAAAAAVIVGLSTAAAGAEELRVAATPVPHADILKLIEPDLQKDGYDLKIVEFSDYVSPNLALDAGEVDANYYQHKPFLDAAVEHRRLKIASVAPIHILPMAAYSKKVKKITDLADGASVTIPNDPANGGRALLLLEDAGLLKLKGSASKPRCLTSSVTPNTSESVRWKPRRCRVLWMMSISRSLTPTTLSAWV